MSIRSRRVSSSLAALVIGAVLVTACADGSASPSASIDPTRTPAGSLPPSPIPTGPSATPSPVPGDGVDLQVVAAGLDAPVDIATAGDGTGRVFVVEQGGTIRVVDGGERSAEPFLDISDRITSGGERGLLGLAFHPDFPTDPRFFVDYTDDNGDTAVASFRVDPADPDRADPDSEVVLLTIRQPFANHNGGAVAFGNDGMLYVGMGDGGSGGDPEGNGQRLDTLLGKILRLDVLGPDATAARPYGIPSDNPYANGTDALPEIWLTGLRNPWRMRFDEPTGDLWIGDVGQGAWEEIDVIRAGTGGQNLGWNTMEGAHCFGNDSCEQAGLILPVAEYDHDFGCSVTGGVVARNGAVPAVQDRYLFSDYCSGTLWSLDPTVTSLTAPTVVLETGRNISSIELADDGTVLLTDLGRGELLRLASAP